MTPIDRGLLEAPGDVLPRPHDNCYWVIPGLLLAGEHPGAKFADECIIRIDALLDAGMRHFIDLTDVLEGTGQYVSILRERAQERGVAVTHARFAIPDFDVPTPSLMCAILASVYAALEAGEPAYLHCWGGVGRTGTAVGCILREQGLTAREALALLDRKWAVMERRPRHSRSPETPGQIDFVERWPSM